MVYFLKRGFLKLFPRLANIQHKGKYLCNTSTNKRKKARNTYGTHKKKIHIVKCGQLVDSIKKRTGHYQIPYLEKKRVQCVRTIMEIKVLHRLIKDNALTGIIHLDSGTYIFRNDHAHESAIWAWNIRDEYDRAMVHKWQGLPNKHVVELFDIDNPPATVSYQPLLG